ncbi:MAG: TatD family hydrolase [Bacteroidales bacterium]
MNNIDFTYIDTHSHIYQDDYNEDIEQVIHDAKVNGVGRIYLPNVDLDSIEPMISLYDKDTEYFRMMMGLHPTSVGVDFGMQLQEIKSWFDRYSFSAVGEIGIDLYWSRDRLEEQKKTFRIQLNWAREMDLPVVIHTRDSLTETLEIINEFNDLRGIFHSFGGSEDDAKRILESGDFLLGINGVVTFKNSTLRDTLKSVPLSKIVLETDAPYLTPVPYRGKRNHPAYIPIIADHLSRVYDVSAEEIGRQTTLNAINLLR